MPKEIRIGLVRQDLPDKAGRMRKIKRLPEDLQRGNTNLAPSLLNERIDARAVDVFAEACPADCRGALETQIKAGGCENLNRMNEPWGSSPRWCTDSIGRRRRGHEQERVYRGQKDPSEQPSSSELQRFPLVII